MAGFNVEELISLLDKDFPELIADLKNGIAFEGKFKIFDDGQEIDHYLIRIQLSQNHPQHPPDVYEIGGRIEKSPDRHINHDGTCCLFVKEETKRFWGDHQDIIKFIKGPIHSFFVYQSIYEIEGKWINGARGHGDEGIVEFYEEELNLKDRKKIPTFVRIAANNDYKGHYGCPCGSGKRYRDCHRRYVESVRTIVGIERLIEVSSLFKKNVH